MASRWHTVKIGSIFLTDTGLVGGTACKVSIEGIEGTQSSYASTIVHSASGLPYAQVISVGALGKQFDVVCANIPESTYEAIISAVNTALGAGSTLRVIAAGDSGDFDYLTIPESPNPKKVGGYSYDWVQDARWGFWSVAAGA